MYTGMIYTCKYDDKIKHRFLASDPRKMDPLLINSVVIIQQTILLYK